MAHVLRSGVDVPAMERAGLETTPDGRRLSAVQLRAHADASYELRLTILVDGAWRPRTVAARIEGAGEARALALTGDGAGTWTAGEEPLVALYGAVDVSAAWTPLGLTPAIRRLDLSVGETGELVVVEIPFPGRDLARARYRLHRLDPDHYELTTGEGRHVLQVADDGLVTSWPGRWERVLHEA